MSLAQKEHEESSMNWAIAFFTYLGYMVMITVRNIVSYYWSMVLCVIIKLIMNL